MSSLEQEFVRLAFVESKSYADIETILHISRQTVKELWDKLSNEREKVNKVKRLYNRKKRLMNGVSFQDFYTMYTGQELYCCYCGITQEEINQLFAQEQVKTKRSGTRGRSLELERVRPNEDYGNLDNLKLACYWCNNAKSDEFNEIEFKPVGIEIGKALRARLKS